MQKFANKGPDYPNYANYTKMRYANLYNWIFVTIFIRKYHLTSASAVQRSLSALQEKDIVTSNNGQYFIYDYFLYYWLKQQ